jgi:hypothetical protein
MTDKKAYSPPMVNSEGLTVGVFGNYNGCFSCRGKGKKRGHNKWWRFWGFK